MLLPILLLSLVLLAALTLRLLYVLPVTRPRPSPAPAPRNGRQKHLMILLGSGGHTAEMLHLLTGLQRTAGYKRTYVYTSGDSLSARKAAAFEAAQDYGSTYTVCTIPRARRVRQSWLTTPLDCGRCLLGCAAVYFGQGAPDLVVCNGPGSAVFMVVVVLGARFLGLAQTRTMYVESFARIRSLSLSGKILYPLVDRFLVQWPRLAERYPRAEYKGMVV